MWQRNVVKNAIVGSDKVMYSIEFFYNWIEKNSSFILHQNWKNLVHVYVKFINFGIERKIYNLKL